MGHGASAAGMHTRATFVDVRRDHQRAADEGSEYECEISYPPPLPAPPVPPPQQLASYWYWYNAYSQILDQGGANHGAQDTL